MPLTKQSSFSLFGQADRKLASGTSVGDMMSMGSDARSAAMALVASYDRVADHEKEKWLECIGLAIDTQKALNRTARESTTGVLNGLPGSIVEYSEHDEYTTCFARLCRLAGVDVAGTLISVTQLPMEVRQRLAAVQDAKVCLVAYGRDDYRNHVTLVFGDSRSTKVEYQPVGEGVYAWRVFAVTTMQEFFTGSLWLTHSFYMNEDDNADGFVSAPYESSATGATSAAGAGFGSQLPSAATAAAGTSGGAVYPPAPESVADDEVRSGGANVTGGVVRAPRRNIGAKSTAGLRTTVPKNYATVGRVMFNNFDELYQDSVSRDLAQEIMEDLWKAWALPTNQPVAMKYAEDMLLSFMIAVTASNKADYNRVFAIPVEPFDVDGRTVTELDADFSRLSAILTYKYGVTRRQFSRGLADDQRQFLKLEDNVSLLPTLATRVGCEALLAYLAFDGSTHCTNLTTREVSFTKALESRNLFERDDDLAKGASDRLMQGFSGGVRSVAPR